MTNPHERRYGWVLPGLILALAAGCGDGAQGPTDGTTSYTPRFEETTCWGGVTDADVTCGHVVVPEDRSDPDGRQVRLAVARLAARSTPTRAPLLYLHGGPGGGVQGNLAGWTGSSLRDDQELILLDQRGSGLSEPLLNCPERETVTWETFSQTGDLPAERQATRDATVACRDRLEADGVNLAAYDTVANANDVADIRIALGIDEWSIYGVSYGTTLALEVMRSHPEGVRAVVLDSAYPLDQGPTVGREANTADRAFQALSDGCARDPACTELMGGSFLDYLAETIAEFDADPYELQGTDERTGITYDLRLDGADVYAGIFNAMYDTGLVAIMPTVVQQVRSRNPVFLQTAADDGINRINDLHEMAFTAIECRDRGRDWAYGDVEDLVTARPELSTLYNVFAQTFCDIIDVGSIDAARNTAVVSDIPAVVFGGEFDPITPPEWGRQASESLSQSTYFEFPGLGHGAVFADACPYSIMEAFLDDPGATPDGSCIADMNVPFP